MTTSDTRTTYSEAAIEADPDVPMIRIRRDFDATLEQLFRAHTDPELFARWIGPAGRRPTIDRWDPVEGGSWRYSLTQGDDTQSFRGSFHTVRPDRLVQTFTWEGMPDQVALETMTFENLGGGRTRLHATSLCDSLDARDAWLRSGMESGVNEGYAALDAMLAEGSI
jgi:uncharacterized protein YndB with AHSA1/START domain